MKKKQPDTFPFPEEIQKRHYRLINSKDDFLRNLSTADQQRLETLYAQLNAAWKANNTEQLNRSLQQKYHELRTTQHEISNDCSAFRHRTRSELKSRFAVVHSRLQKRQENLAQNVKTWKADIIAKEASWNVRKLSIDQTARTKLTELKRISSNLEQETAQYRIARNNLEQKKLQLTNELAKQDEQQQLYNEEWQRCQTNSELLKTNWLRRIASKGKLSEQILSSRRQQSKQQLSEIEKSLEADTISIENKLLTQLQNEIADDLPDCHPELLTWLRQGDSSSIQRRNMLLTKESEQLTTALNQGLTKIGLSIEEFIKKVETYK